MKIKILVLLFGLSFSLASAQNDAKLSPPKPSSKNAKATKKGDKDKKNAEKENYRPRDGYYNKKDMIDAKVIPYPSLREADVFYAKRVWREIDLREKMNQYLGSPKARLIDVLVEALNSGEIVAYDPVSTKDDPNGDEFTTPLKPEDVMRKLGSDSTAAPIFDETGVQTGTKMVFNEFNPDSIVKFRIKEDWIFDRQRSVFEPRIIGIAPLVKIKTSAGALGDEQPAFWIYFPDARQVLANRAVEQERNDATQLSFDGVFLKRIFTSYIVKESNQNDFKVKDYANGIDKLYESERIKKQLIDYEQDLLEY